MESNPSDRELREDAVFRTFSLPIKLLLNFFGSLQVGVCLMGKPVNMDDSLSYLLIMSRKWRTKLYTDAVWFRIFKRSPLVNKNINNRLSEELSDYRLEIMPRGNESCRVRFFAFNCVCVYELSFQNILIHRVTFADTRHKMK